MNAQKVIRVGAAELVWTPGVVTNVLMHDVLMNTSFHDRQRKTFIITCMVIMGGFTE
jgi:hypothetical protein